jgi:hypothetical protein
MNESHNDNRVESRNVNKIESIYPDLPKESDVHLIQNVNEPQGFRLQQITEIKRFLEEEI